MATPYDDAKKALAAMEDGANKATIALGILVKALEQKHGLAPANDISKTTEYIHWQNGLALKQKHVEWGRKLLSQIEGYGREMQVALTNINKDRLVDFIKADVTVGTTELYAKAVQLKYTVGDDSQVDTMIAKAANQLTGDTGEKPLPTQRKIIDVTISDPTNWWPFYLKDLNSINIDAELNGSLPLTLFKKLAAQRILAQLSAYKKKKKGLDATTQQGLMNFVPTMLNPNPNLVKDAARPKSTALYQPVQGNQPNQPALQHVDLVQIKIRYAQPRTFVDNNALHTIRTAVFAAYNRNANLTVEFQEYK